MSDKIEKIRKISRFPRADRAYPGKEVEPLPGAMRRGVRTEDLLPEQVKIMARIIGTERARRIWKLVLAGMDASLPEMCAYDWLQSRHFTFSMEDVMLGGRREPGGAVVDFLIYDITPAGYYIWRVMGDYWHGGLERSSKDEIQKVRLEAMKIGGIPIVAVVDLWESRIYNDWPHVFLMAEMGVSLGQL